MRFEICTGHKSEQQAKRTFGQLCLARVGVGLRGRTLLTVRKKEHFNIIIMNVNTIRTMMAVLPRAQAAIGRHTHSATDTHTTQP